ncbi:hypothetical protein Scep_017230 [Stephania cephalantha]|uniref:Uncharacterized protein n=1 Tax=Stephania cephalantha TaxID=152367 RepID=A0AAP0NTD3_9MAGN
MRMGAERGGQAVGADREEDGENLQLGADGEEGVETRGGGEAVGAEDRAERSGRWPVQREEVGENLSKSALAARTKSEPTDEVVSAEAMRGVQRRSVGCRVHKRVNLCV